MDLVLTLIAAPNSNALGDDIVARAKTVLAGMFRGWRRVRPAISALAGSASILPIRLFAMPLLVSMR